MAIQKNSPLREFFMYEPIQIALKYLPRPQIEYLYFGQIHVEAKKTVQTISIISSRAGERDKQYHMSVEDKFIDTVLDNLKTTTNTNSNTLQGHEKDKNVNIRHFTNNNGGTTE